MRYEVKDILTASLFAQQVSLIDGLTKEEQSTIFSILDAFVAKRKLKSTLKTALQDMD